MKKTILLIAGVMTCSLTFAQDLTSKKGETMLPEEGDFSLGFDAAPFLNYVGNFLNAGAVAPSADWTNTDLAITGKMFADANTAYRAKVRIGFGSQTNITLTDTNTSSFGAPVYIEDDTTTSYNAITIGCGIEKRRGNTRVQGIYGGEAMLNLGGGKTTFGYGQALGDNYDLLAPRPTEDKLGSTLGVTIRGFAGIEVFVFPKVSIGFEYGWGLGFTSTGTGERTTESWDLVEANAPSQSLITSTTQTKRSSEFGFDTDNSGGALTINFHF
jgi:hypothetical protein